MKKGIKITAATAIALSAITPVAAFANENETTLESGIYTNVGKGFYTASEFQKLTVAEKKKIVADAKAAYVIGPVVYNMMNDVILKTNTQLNNVDTTVAEYEAAHGVTLYSGSGFKPEPITNLKVESVSAITATTVTVDIDAPTTDLAEQTVVVKDVNGTEYKVKPVTIKAGATTATFTFETPLTVSPIASWTVNGVAYAPATFEIVNVEPLSATNKYLEVQFNKPLTALAASEVAIRNTDTLERFGVEKVELAADGLSATVTIIGDELTGAFPAALQDYALTITQGGKVTATTTFNLDLVHPNEYIGTSSVVNNTVDGFKLAENITVDFEEVLGRTATYWTNKDGFITKFNLQNQTVKYDAIEITEDRNSKLYAKLVGENKEYALATNSSGAVTTAVIEKNGSFTPADGEEFEYAKVIFNNRGEVSSVVVLDTFTSSILAESTNGTIVNGKGLSTNLKDYTIVKDGKSISAAGIKAGDVVFYNAAVKFAEVYNKSVTGPIQGVYAGEYKFNGEVEEFGDARYVNAEGKFVTLDQAGIEALAASKKDVTIYYDRNGNVELIVGELGEVVSATTQAYLTANTKTYELATENTVELATIDTAGNKVTAKVELSKLKSITVEGSTTVKHEVGKNNVAKFALDSTVANAATTINAISSGGVVLNSVNISTLNKDDVVEIVKDKDGVIVGLNIIVAEQLTAAPTTKIELTAKTINVTDTVNGGNKNVQLKSTTPVFWYDNTKSTPVVSSTTWGALAEKGIKSIDEANFAAVYHNGTDVESLVINAGGVEVEADTVEKEVVISQVNFNTDGDVAYIKVWDGTTEKELTVTEEIANAGFGVGQVVTAEVTKDKEELVALTPVASQTAYRVITESVTATGFSAVNGGTQETFEAASTENGSLYVYALDKNGKVQLSSLADLSALELDNEVTITRVASGSKYLNVVLVTQNDNDTLVTGAATIDGAPVDVYAGSTSIADVAKVEFSATASNYALIKNIEISALSGGTVADKVVYSATEPVYTFDNKEIVFSKLAQFKNDGTVDVDGSYTLEFVIDDGAKVTRTTGALTVAPLIKANIVGSVVNLSNNYGADFRQASAVSPVSVVADGSGVSVGTYSVDTANSTGLSALTAAVSTSGAITIAGTLSGTTAGSAELTITDGSESITLDVTIATNGTITVAVQ